MTANGWWWEFGERGVTLHQPGCLLATTAVA